jgi:hypothetical protein
MNRLRRWSVVALMLTLTCPSLSPGRGDPPQAKAGGEKWLLDRALTISPRAEPTPALKYRLLPMMTELKEGNAVPIYLRLMHEQTDELRKHWRETPHKWNELPLDQVPLDEAKKFLDGVRGRFLVQFDYGARRKTAEWNYTLEQPDPISILLPDAQQMRGYVPMMVLRTRVDIAEGKYADAAHSFQTGFGFSRHVANGPFVISGLVGVAIASQLADRIPEWIERPDSPNLYWSLTALPRPLIDIRAELEFEQRVVEMQFPDLADLDRLRTPGEWDVGLKRLRAEVRRIGLMIDAGNEANKKAAKEPEPPLPDPDEPASKATDLAAARQFVTGRLGKSAAEVAAMPPAQVLMLYTGGQLADTRDDMFKFTYLPVSQALARLQEADARLQSMTGGEGVRLSKWMLPAIAKVLMAVNRLERKLMLLRVIEALRIHAASHGGRLPATLDQITEVPVPLDPGTGKPFEYQSDGTTATLVSVVPDEPRETRALRYRVTLRK